jgi:uncharacterized protein YbjQ (UPF0145 family)
MASASKSKRDSKDGKSKAAESQEVPSCFVETHGVITTTMNDLPGYRIKKIFGTIYGITVRSRNWGADIGSFLKSAVGGEIRYFTSLMYTSRNSAVERMVGECMQRGGNAIIAMRFDQSEVSFVVAGHAPSMHRAHYSPDQHIFTGLRVRHCGFGRSHRGQRGRMRLTGRVSQKRRSIGRVC